MPLDYNSNYSDQDKRVIIDDPDATFQFIENAIMIGDFEIYYSEKDAINLPANVFDFLTDFDEESTLKRISDILFSLNPLFKIVLDQSYVRVDETRDSVVIQITFKSSGQIRKLYRRINS